MRLSPTVVVGRSDIAAVYEGHDKKWFGSGRVLRVTRVARQYRVNKAFAVIKGTVGFNKELVGPGSDY